MTKESVFFREKNKKRRQRGLDKGRRIKVKSYFENMNDSDGCSFTGRKYI